MQRRLDGLGLAGDDEPGRFGGPTQVAVRLFQQRRHLPADGVVDEETWQALVEAGLRLGDRLLYATRPLLAGDDVRELQERLNALGFLAGQVDGLFGPDTLHAVEDFQLNVGLPHDGIVGPGTVTALKRLRRRHQSAAAARVREREGLRRARRTSIVGARVVVDPAHGPAHPGVVAAGLTEHEVAWDVAARVRARLTGLGAIAQLSRGPLTAPPPVDRATTANDLDAEAVVSIAFNAHPTPAASGAIAFHWGTADDVSEAGRRLADLAHEQVVGVMGSADAGVHPSTRTILRATRAPTVILEPGFLSGEHDGRLLHDPMTRRALGDAISDAIRTFLTSGFA